MKLQSTIALLLLAMSGAEPAVAELVVPVDSVATHVNIRFAPDAESEIVGRLYQGTGLRLVRTTGGWHEVELDGGGTGYVNADWAQVIDDAEHFGGQSVTAQTDPVPSGIADGKEDAAEPGTVADVADTQSPEESADPAVAAANSATEPSSEAAPGDDVDGKPADTVNSALPEGSTVMHEADTEVSETADSPEPEQQATDSAGSPGLEGSVDYLVKFVAPTEGGSSQIFDNGRNVGIGTTDPQQRLEVNGNIQIHERNSSVAGLMITQSDGETGYLMHNRASTLTIGAGSVDRITITRDGNVGFGMNRPAHPIEMASGAHVTSGGVWTNSSSIENKENVRELTSDEALAALLDLEPVRFNYKADSSEDYLGFIAEDVPELVATRDRSGLSPMDIVALLTRVVQEQQKKIAELEMRVADIPAAD